MSRSLPPALKAQVDALIARDSEAKVVIDSLIAFLVPASAAAPAQDASSVLKDATVFENMSLVLPDRRRAVLAIGKKDLAVVVNDSVLLSGSWDEFDLALCLPVPDKPKPTWNVVVTSSSGNGQFIVFAVQDQAADKFLAGAKPSSIRNVLLNKLAPQVAELIDAPLLTVVAHDGRREGVLYFLHSYLFFGFKKPLALFPLDAISSISYTVVTRLTFNVVIKLVSGVEREFGMIPHDDFEAINEYMATHGLTDESLAETRKAKRAKTEAHALEDAEKQAVNVAGVDYNGTESENEEEDEGETEGDSFEDGGSGSDGDERGSGDESD